MLSEPLLFTLANIHTSLHHAQQLRIFLKVLNIRKLAIALAPFLNKRARSPRGVLTAKPYRCVLGLRIARERERHPDPTGSPMGMPIRQEPGNRGETPDRAVGSPGHLGHLTALKIPLLSANCHSRTGFLQRGL